MRPTIDRRPRLRSTLIAGAAALAIVPAAVHAQTAASPPAGNNNPAQARTMQQAPATHAAANGDQTVDVGGWPKVSFDSVISLDYAHMSSKTGPDRGPG